MDATQLGRWTRFAAKGGIGKCTALQDCVAERAEDLMFLKGDEITVLMRVEDEKDKFLGYCEGVVGRFEAARVRFHSKLKTPVRTKRSSSIGVKRPTSSSFRPVSRDSISAASSTSTLIPVSKPSGSSTPSAESPLPDPSYHVPSLTSSTSSSAHGSGSPLTPSDISALTAPESIATSFGVSESYASIESRHYAADSLPNKTMHSTHRERSDSGTIPHPSTPPLLAATHFSTSPTLTDDGDDDDDDGIHQPTEQTSAEQSQPTQNPPSPTPTFSDASVYSSDERRISHIPTLSTHRDAELPPPMDAFETPRRPASEATGPDAADSSFAEDLSFEPRNSRISLPVSESEGTTGIGLSLLQNFISGGDDSDSDGDSQTDTSSHAHEATTSTRGHVRARSSFDQTVEGFPVPPADIPLSPPFPASPPHQASFARPDSEATSEYDYGVDWEGASDIYDNYRYSRASMMSKMSVTSRRTPFTPPPIPDRPSFDRQGSSDAASLRSDYSLPSPEMQRRFTPPMLSPTRPLMTTKSRPPPIEVSGSPPLSTPLAGPSPLLHTTFGSLENSPVHTPSTLDTAHPMPTPVSPNMTSMNSSVERPQGAASALRQRLEVERRASTEFVLASSSSTAVVDHARGAEPTISSESGIIVSDDEDDEGGLRARDVGPLAATLNKTKEAMLDSPLIVVNQVPPPPSYRESTSDIRSSLTVESQARFHDMPVPVLARPPSDAGLPVPLSPPASGRSPSGSTAADVSPPATFPPNPMSSLDLSVPPARPRPPRQQANAHDPATRQSLFGSSRTSVFMPHPNAPKPASVPTGPMYGRQPLQQVAAPSAAQTMHIAAAGRIGPNGVRRLGTFFGMCESELLEALEPVPIKWTLDPPNDIPANRMKRVASEANLQQQQQQKAQQSGSTRVASPASPGVEEGGTIPRANFFPKASGARPRSQSFSGFDSPFPVPQRPPSVTTNNQEDTSRSTRSSIDSNASRASVGQSGGPDLPATTRGGGKRQYTPSPLALQAAVSSRSQPLQPSSPAPEITPAQPPIERLTSPHGTVKARSPLTIDVPPPCGSDPLSPLPLGMPRLPASPASMSASASPMQQAPSLPPASPAARMPTSASPLVSSFSSGRPTSPISPTASPPESTTQSPASARRRQDSERQRRTSGETESSHYSDTRSMMSSPPLMGSPLRRSTSLRSKLSFSTLRSPRSATRDDAGIISPTMESHTVQVEDLDFELITPAQPPSQTTAHSVENGSPIIPPPSLADSAHLRVSAASPTGSSFSVPRSPTSPFALGPPQASVSAPGPSTESMEAHRQRELKWVALMSSTKAAEARKNKKVRKLLQEGVPASVRYQVWAHLTDSRSKRLEGLYPRLCARGRVAVSDEIERDVRAAFERDSRLDSKSLVSLLQAYVTMVPDIQYEPGLTYVAGQLLLQSPEEDAFWIFISLMDTHLRPYFAANGVQLEVDAALFAKAVEANDPTVAKRLFVDYSIPPIDVVRPWFSSLFVEALPVEYFQRVWDVFLSEGVVFLFRVGVAVLICCRRTLLDTKGDAAVLNLLRNPPIMLISSTPDRLIDLANSIKLKDDDIRKQRVKMEAQVKRQVQGKLFGAGGARANASSPSISLPSRS